MLRSRPLFLIAALTLAACHSGGDAQAPSSRAETTSADTNPVAEQDARTALNAALPGLKSCRRGGGSSLDATVTFEPSGKVGTVDVTPASDPAAECVRGKLTEVAVMPFRGGPVTMAVQVRM